MNILAHGLSFAPDQPIPTWLLAWAAAIVLTLSFLLLGALWSKPVLDARARGRPLPWARWAVGPVVYRTAQTISATLFVVTFVAALVGTTDPSLNLAPTVVYVVLWLGVPWASALLGNVWSALNPWRAFADLFVGVWEATGRTARPLAAYPERFGRYPAAVTLFAFAALELAYTDPSDPRSLALAIALYSYVTFAGYAAFGRATWGDRGEGFGVAFALIARIAPLHSYDRTPHLRWPLTGLSGSVSRGTIAVVAVMLGSTVFDGISRLDFWRNLIASAAAPHLIERPALGDLIVSGISLGGLLATVVLVAALYLGTCRIAQWIVDSDRTLYDQFVLGLVPIALGYSVAHYASLMVVQIQFLLPLGSDPLGRGWDLFGAADWIPDLTPLSPQAFWYIQVTALVIGHVAGLVVAHDRAVVLFGERREATRSQLPFLFLMVLYTAGGLWLLSRG